MRLKAKQKVFHFFILLFFFFCMDSFFAKILGANEQVRQPHFAGTWYSSQTKVLDSDLSRYLQTAKEKTAKPKPGNILAIISPHAGYIFSGQTAAFAYEGLLSNKYKRVFLLGPSHHIAFKGIAIPRDNFFVTPLGNIEVDRIALQKLLKQPYFRELDTVFDTEHSLEMQLPWIRKTLGNVKLIPLAVGIVGNDEIKYIANSIKNELTDGDLVIVSSDFTHYGPRYDYEPFSNEPSLDKLKAKIKELDLRAFDCLKTLDSQTLLQFYESTHDTICGIYPCSVLLSLLPSNADVKLLNYATSQYMQKDLEGNSVSYMAIVFSAPNNKSWSTVKKSTAYTNQEKLSEIEGETLLRIARVALTDYLQGKRIDPVKYAESMNPTQRARFMEKRGVFVTLYKKPKTANNPDPNQHKELRGCIGYIYPSKPLLLGVCENAINAACNDPRFNPATLDELDHLSLEISVLTPPKAISNWQDIKIGQDGIVLHKNGKQSVFLPKVATEFGWDLSQTLSQLSLKAGLSMYDWQEKAQFEIFQSQSFSE